MRGASLRNAGASIRFRSSTTFRRFITIGRTRSYARCSNVSDAGRHQPFSPNSCAKARSGLRLRSPVFLSIGSGDGNNEVEIAQLLRARGLEDFRIDCLELNPTLIKRATGDARTAGLSSQLHFLRGDFNKWRPRRRYDGVVANQSLHHVTNLEGLFDAVRDALAPGAFFVANDVIGRNGHQRWPEALHFVERFWRKLPRSHRFHHQFRRYEESFVDWDCSAVGFEGIRAQDVLPLLLERFHFHVFVGYGNAIDPFVDRGFGPSFDAAAAWDRAFVDCVHACDERALLAGYLTPTHMMAVMASRARRATVLRARPFAGRIGAATRAHRFGGGSRSRRSRSLNVFRYSAARARRWRVSAITARRLRRSAWCRRRRIRRRMGRRERWSSRSFRSATCRVSPCTPPFPTASRRAPNSALPSTETALPRRRRWENLSIDCPIIYGAGRRRRSRSAPVPRSISRI